MCCRLCWCYTNRRAALLWPQSNLAASFTLTAHLHSRGVIAFDEYPLDFLIGRQGIIATGERAALLDLLRCARAPAHNRYPIRAFDLAETRKTEEKRLQSAIRQRWNAEGGLPAAPQDRRWRTAESIMQRSDVGGVPPG